LVADLGESNDNLLLELADPTTLRLTINGDSHDYAFDAVRQFSVTGAGGDDVIEIAGGVAVPAVLQGGAGNDTLIGGLAADLIDGGDGSDVLRGEGGDDQVMAEPADTVVGGDGYNSIVLDVLGTSGADAIQLVNVNEGTVRLTVNGVAFDYDRRELVSANIDAGSGDDWVELLPDVTVNAAVLGGDGNDTLIGGAGTDTLDAGAGSDSLSAGAADDVLFAKPGDAIDSGDGADTLTLRATGTGDADSIQLDYLDALTTRLTINGVSYDYVRAELLAVAIDGNAGDDLVQLAGDLTISATLVGGNGNDTLVGGLSPDVIDGRAGNDSLTGSDGADSIWGGDGFDTLDAGAGPDFGDGGFNDDSLLGGDAADTLLGGAGHDTLSGDTGDDSIAGDAGDPVFDDPTDGNDLIQGGDDNDTLSGNGGSDSLAGQAGNDSISGDSGDDSLAGDDGDDFLSGGAGNDQLDGGPDFDIVDFAGTHGDDAISADPDVPGLPLAIVPFVIANGTETDRGGNVEILSVLAWAGNDSVVVDGELDIDVMLDGGDGNDTLTGGHGSDLLTGGAGNDSITSGGGYDMVRFYGTDLDDTITAIVRSSGRLEISNGTETDTGDGIGKLYVNAQDGNDSFGITFEPGAPALDLWLEGRSGNDTLFGGPYDDFIYAGGGDDSVDAGAGDDIVLAASGDDIVFGGDGHDWIAGTTGYDSIDAGAGNDSVFGGDDDDTIDGGAGDDLLDGEADFDSISGGDGQDTIAGGDGDDTLLGGDGDDSITGDFGNDVIDGGAGSDTMVGGDGDDLVDGQSGDDFIYGGQGNDRISGGDGNDTLGSDQGDDSFFGGNGDDQISGGADDDLLDGGEGNDLLDGGFGGDQLIGGRRDIPRRDQVGCDNDTLRAGADDDLLDGGRGRDLLDGGLGSNDITADLGRDTLLDSGGINRILHVRKNDENCRRNGVGRSVRRPHRNRSDDRHESSGANRGNRPSSPTPASVIRSHEGEGGDHGKANLVITRTSSAAPVPSAQGLIYAYTVTNAGPKKAFMVTVYDTLPAGIALFSATGRTAGGEIVTCSWDKDNNVICDLGTLNDSATATAGVTFDTVVDAYPGTVTNIASVTSANRETNPADNKNTVNIQVTEALETVRVFASTDFQPSEPSNMGRFSVCREFQRSTELVVSFQVGGKAQRRVIVPLLNDDYTLSGTLSTDPYSVKILANKTCATLDVSPIDDTLPEGPEDVVITLNDGTVYLWSDHNTATLLIADDDVFRPTVTITSSEDPDASEAGLNPGKFTINRSGPTSSSLVVYYTINSSVLHPANHGIDYNYISEFLDKGNVRLGIGVSSKEIPIQVIPDDCSEGPESVVLDLQQSESYLLGSSISATVTIADNDKPTFEFGVLDGDTAEPGQTNTATLYVTTTSCITIPFSVSYQVNTSSSTAELADIEPLPGSVTVQPTGDSAYITVRAKDDLEVDDPVPETLVVDLTPSPTNYILGPSTSVAITIIDNDQTQTPDTVTIEASLPDAYEQGEVSGKFTVSRTKDTTELTVLFVVTGNAHAGDDYYSFPWSVTIPAGSLSADIIVKPKDDSVPNEPDETVSVGLTRIAGLYEVGTPGSATVTIHDNDCSPIRVKKITSSLGSKFWEGKEVTYTASLNPVTANVRVPTYKWYVRKLIVRPENNKPVWRWGDWEAASGIQVDNKLIVNEADPAEKQYKVEVTWCNEKTEAQLSVFVEAAYPVNLRVLGANDQVVPPPGRPAPDPTGRVKDSDGSYYLHVNYAFESSSGNILDLDGVNFGEYIWYHRKGLPLRVYVYPQPFNYDDNDPYYLPGERGFAALNQIGVVNGKSMVLFSDDHGQGTNFFATGSSTIATVNAQQQYWYKVYDRPRNIPPKEEKLGNQRTIRYSISASGGQWIYSIDKGDAQMTVRLPNFPSWTGAF